MVDVGAASLQNIGNPPREEHGCGTLQILYNTVHGIDYVVLLIPRQVGLC